MNLNWSIQRPSRGVHYINSEDIECVFCGAHWMQSCSCTQDQVNEVEKFRKWQRENSVMEEPVPLEELINQQPVNKH